MKKRKIVHVTTVHWPQDVRIFEKQCRTLVDAGHRVVLIASWGDTAMQALPESIEGVELLPLAPASNRLQRMLGNTYRAYRLAREEHADLIHLHDPELLLWARRLQRQGVPVVFDMHENVPEDLKTKVWLPRWLRPLVSGVYRRLERRLLRGIAVVFAEHSYATDYPWVRQAATVLNLPRVDQLLALQADKHTRPTVAYMGAVSRDRGTEVTLEALDRLNRKGLKVDWDCVGPVRPPQYGPALEAQIARRGLTGVRLHGLKSALDGYRIVAACHIGLAVLEAAPNFVNSYPTKLFEYMALGLPVIASNFPLYRSIVEGEACGLCVNPADADELAAAIEYLVTHPAESQEFGRRGQQAVHERYNWESQAAELLGFYERLWAGLDNDSNVRTPDRSIPSLQSSSS